MINRLSVTSLQKHRNANGWFTVSSLNFKWVKSGRIEIINDDNLMKSPEFIWITCSFDEYVNEN